MSLAELSVRRPVFIACLFLATLGLGYLSLIRLPISLYPDVTFPVVNIVVPFPGATPNEVEEQLTKPIENEISSLAGLRLVRSLSLEGAAVVTAVFKMETDIRFAEPKIVEAMARVRPNLPSGILDPVVRSVDPSETPIATLSLTADLSETQLVDLADRDVRPFFEQIPEVGRVNILGARKREIQVELSLEKLKRLQMSAAEVVGRMQASGLNVPAGQIENREHEILIRSVGQFSSLDAIRSTPIRSMGSHQVIVLGDVATVTDGLEDEANRVSINGAKAIVIRIYRRSGANAVEASDHIRASIEKIANAKNLKANNFHLQMLRDGARPVRAGIHDAAAAILFGLILTIAVVFFFLGNIRSTVITGLALPNSILGAFFLMWMCGFSINITTLAALALAIGLLIDDAIVVRENIYRRMELGDSPRDAAVLGTREVALAVTATTFTVLAVFGPVSFLQGLIGQFFKQFGLTICFAMLISLLDSLTIAPMLSANFGRGAPTMKATLTDKIVAPFHRLQNGLQQSYGRLLELSLRFPRRVLGLAVVICAGSGVLLRFIPKAFVPNQESGEFQVVFDLPAGVSLDVTDRALQSASQSILKHSEVAQALVTAGGEFGERNRGQILVILKPKAERKLLTNEVKEQIRHDIQNLPNVTFRIEDLLDVGGGAGHPYTVKISGESITDIQSAASQLVSKLNRSGDLQDISQSYRRGANEIRWTLMPEKLKQFGVSSGEAGYELRLLVAGATPARLHQDDRETKIHVRRLGNTTDIQNYFDDVQVPNFNHQLLPLSTVARRDWVETPASILREDRKPIIEVTAELNPSGKGLAAALDETSRLFQSGEITVAPGTDFEYAGQTKDFQDLLKNVILAGILSVAAMYLVLASLYNSFFVPLSIMLVLPLAVCGAFYGLWITRSPLDIYSMIGCILLMGVAAKNSILLVDSIHAGIRGGQDMASSIRRAADVRFRPILMTSFALIAGMLPLALPLQEATRGQAPMAIAVIGGVISSTLLTLVVVPAAYGYILRLENWVLRWTVRQ